MSVADSQQYDFINRQSDPWPFTESARRVLPSGVALVTATISSEPRELRNKRELEYQTGRQCANLALQQLGGEGPVTRADDRSPIWPSGFAGSITHNDQLCCVAACHQVDFRSIGIDVETIVSTKTRNLLRDEIATPEEWNRARQLGFDDETNFTLIFSAKESFYKCWYPVTKKFFGFRQANIKRITQSEIHVAANEGNPNFLRSPSLLTIKYLVNADCVFTATSMRSSLEASQ